MIRADRRLGFEFKRTAAPVITRSMHAALADLKLERLFVLDAGLHTFDMRPRVRALAFGRLLEDLKALR